MTIREQLSHFHGLKGGEGQWSAYCPCCESGKDRGNRHLALSQGEGGKLLLHCFHGCRFEAIVKAAGLSGRDCAKAGQGEHRDEALGSAKTPTKRPQVWSTVETAIAALEQRTQARCAGRWDYTDSFVMLRFNRADGGKTYRPLHQETRGWACGDPPEPLPLYGLNTLSAEGLVWIPEGEKCSDALAGLGCPAVTSAHGAKLPGKSDWQPLAGRDVCIWPDADKPGREYAEAVAAILTQLNPPARVRSLTPPEGLPEGGDVCDWLEPLDAKESGELRQTLLGLAEEAQEWASDAGAEIPGNLEGVFDRPAAKIMSFAEFAAAYPVEDEPVIEGWLRRGQVGTICGASKARKSWLLNNIIISAIQGHALFNQFPVAKSKALLIDYELQPGSLRKRLIEVALKLGAPLDLPGLSVLSLRGLRVNLDGLTAMIKDQSPDIIIIDPLYRTYPPQFDENSNAAMAELYAQLQELAERHSAAMVVSHHLTKGSQAGKTVVDLGSGAGSLARAADAHIGLREHSEEDCAVLAGVIRSFPPFKPLCLRWQHPLWTRDDSLDPELLAEGSRRKRTTAVQPEKTKKDAFTPERFAEAFVTCVPRARAEILTDAMADGLSENKAKILLNSAESKGLVHRWEFGRAHAVQFATVAQPKEASEKVSCV